MPDDGKYRKVLGVDVPPAPKQPFPLAQSSKPPPGEVTVAWRDWKFKAPAAVLLALGSALGSAIAMKALPTPSPTDARIDILLAKQANAEKEADRSRTAIEDKLGSIVRSQQAQEESSRKTEAYLRDRMTQLEDRVAAERYRRSQADVSEPIRPSVRRTQILRLSP